MNEYDIQCTLEEMIRDGHTKFEFGFSRHEHDGHTMWTDLKLEKTMKDLAIQFCEEQATKGADFNATMSDLVHGGNPTADEFIAWIIARQKEWS